MKCEIILHYGVDDEYWGGKIVKVVIIKLCWLLSNVAYYIQILCYICCWHKFVSFGCIEKKTIFTQCMVVKAHFFIDLISISFQVVQWFQLACGCICWTKFGKPESYLQRFKMLFCWNVKSCQRLSATYSCALSHFSVEHLKDSET